MAKKNPTTNVNRLYCDVCGRCLPKKKPGSGGRPRSRHRECSKALGYLSSFEDSLSKIRWDETKDGDRTRGKQYIAKMRSRVTVQTINQFLAEKKLLRWSHLCRDFTAR
jgi:hypothetical protein